MGCVFITGYEIWGFTHEIVVCFVAIIDLCPTEAVMEPNLDSVDETSEAPSNFSREEVKMSGSSMLQVMKIVLNI